MKILIAEDELVSRTVLETTLSAWGHEVIAVADGSAAVRMLLEPQAPRIAILDWEMPGLSGPDVCRYIRATAGPEQPYLLVLTAREGRENIAAAIRSGANDYLIKPFDPEEMRVRLDIGMSLLEMRQLEAMSRELEKRVAERTAELARVHAENERIFAAISSVLISLDGEGRVTRWNRVAAQVFDLRGEQVIGERYDCGRIPWEATIISRHIAKCSHENRQIHLKDVPFARGAKHRGYLDLTLTPVPGSQGAPSGTLILGEDRTEQRLLESQLVRAQKLESIGQLAAGIAHEINTPIQYVSDNTVFLRDSFADYRRCLDALRDFLQHVHEGKRDASEIAEVEDILGGADLDYLSEEIPKTLEQTMEGVERVARIVRAMKNFSHPSSDDRTMADLNRLIDSTITVARNEWKYVADVMTDFDPCLPLVPCYIGEFNQVVLNLLVNAAHAIGESGGGSSGEKKGLITVTTRCPGDLVEISVRDTGAGIPEKIRSKIFDPFFTTKPVGKGTGQGLAIAHAVIVGKHGGELTFESEVGTGTTFIIRLPVSCQASSPDKQARLSNCSA